MADKLNFAAAPEMGEAVEQLQPVAEPQPRRHPSRTRLSRRNPLLEQGRSDSCRNH